jgi:hypothetical protein
MWYETSGSARQVELPAIYPTYERLPIDRCESEDWPRTVPGVADRDPTIVNERNLDTAIVVAQSARAPHSVVEIEIPSAAGRLCH